jgi:hypothetical protein
MKIKGIAALLIILNVLFTFCSKDDETITPSDKITEEVKNITGYDNIDASSAFNVNVTFSDTEERIIIEANENLHQYIIVDKVSDRLSIKIRDGISISGNATLIAHITTKQINGYTASGASRFILKNKLTTNDEVQIELSGASKFNGEIVAPVVEAELSGASMIDITGSTDIFDVYASGASHVRDYGFIVNNLDIELSGASSAWLTVNEKMDVVASGASMLNYKGTGTINSQELSGGSQIIKTD